MTLFPVCSMEQRRRVLEYMCVTYLVGCEYAGLCGERLRNWEWNLREFIHSLSCYTYPLRGGLCRQQYGPAPRHMSWYFVKPREGTAHSTGTQQMTPYRMDNGLHEYLC